jgi:hypothetical protein
MRRLGAVSLLVLAVAAAAAAAPPSPGWRTLEEPVYGWRLQAPRSLQAVQFQGFNRITWYGVAIANFPAAPPSLWPLQAPRLPADGVLLRFWHQEAGPHHHPSARDDGLPLSLGRFARYPVGPRPRPRVRTVQLGGTELGIAVWTGPHASRRDRAAAAEIVRRFRPARLETGGVTRPCGFFVLDRVHRYGARAVRRYDVADLPVSDCVAARPFYLVKENGKLSALGWPRDSDGYKRCGVQFDRQKREFFCRNGARWTRSGRVVSVPRGWTGGGDPLARYSVVVGYDGHVLVTTSSYRYP